MLGYGVGRRSDRGAARRARSGPRPRPRPQDATVAVVAHVCGTEQDPQDRDEIIAKLESTGAMVASTNAEAALWAAYVANHAAR